MLILILKKRLYSYKFKNKGIRTQIVTDINDMTLYISKSEFCSDSSDGSMFLNMKLYNKMNKNDVIAIDGRYTLFVNKLIELAKEKGILLNEENLYIL